MDMPSSRRNGSPSSPALAGSNHASGVINPARAGLCRLSLIEKSLDAPLLNGFLQSHGLGPRFALPRPDKFPGSFKAFRGLGQLILRVVVLPQPTFRVAAVPAIISSRGFALDDIDEIGHTKKAGVIPACSFVAPRNRRCTNQRTRNRYPFQPFVISKEIEKEQRSSSESNQNEL